jgi:hypothetical protein
VKRAWFALVIASLLWCALFQLMAIIALPFMLGTSAALFTVFKARGWLQWWQTVLAGFFGGVVWSLLFSATSFEYFDSFGLPNAILWGGIGAGTALFFWWQGRPITPTCLDSSLVVRQILECSRGHIL